MSKIEGLGHVGIYAEDIMKQRDLLHPGAGTADSR